MSGLQTTHTTNSELRPSLSHADNTFGTLRPVLIWKSVVGFPTRMSEGTADTFGAWRHDACIPVGTLPCGGCETGHDVCAAAGLASKGGCYTSTVLA